MTGASVPHKRESVPICPRKVVGFVNDQPLTVHFVQMRAMQSAQKQMHKFSIWSLSEMLENWVNMRVSTVCPQGSLPSTAADVSLKRRSSGAMGPDQYVQLDERDKAIAGSAVRSDRFAIS